LRFAPSRGERRASQQHAPRRAPPAPSLLTPVRWHVFSEHTLQAIGNAILITSVARALRCPSLRKSHPSLPPPARCLERQSYQQGSGNSGAHFTMLVAQICARALRVTTLRCSSVPATLY